MVAAGKGLAPSVSGTSTLTAFLKPSALHPEDAATEHLEITAASPRSLTTLASYMILGLAGCTPWPAFLSFKSGEQT